MGQEYRGNMESVLLRLVLGMKGATLKTYFP
jgi:hypothetical protein